MKRFLPDNRVATAPGLPEGRPPTRAEVWEHFHYLYFDLKGHAETPLCDSRCLHKNEGYLEAFCKEAWVWYYVDAYNRKDWRKQPDWTEGDPVIPEAVPERLFIAGEVSTWNRTIYTCLETARMVERRVAA